jgi:deoxyadenosine/deoxycytidine kinase
MWEIVGSCVFTLGIFYLWNRWDNIYNYFKDQKNRINIKIKSSYIPKAINPSYTDVYSSKYTFIIISGIIGAGKTHLTKSLAESMGFEAEFEPVKENPYLPLFYKDQFTYSFNMQVFLLSKRLAQHQHIVWDGAYLGTSTIQDRSIYEDPIFAKMLHEAGKMTELDFENYCNLFMIMTNTLRRPDLIVFLDVEPETAIKRVKKRGRACEQSIPLSYLKQLRDGYEDWLEDVLDRKIPVLRIDWNEFKSTKYIMKKINEVLIKKRKTLLLV